MSYPYFSNNVWQISGLAPKFDIKSSFLCQAADMTAKICLSLFWLRLQLLNVSMLSSVAYCELAQRNPVENAVTLLERALEKYSMMLTNKTYADLPIL